MADIQTALRHLQAGQLAQAEQVCRDLLQEQPALADALYFLGLIALQCRRYDAAIDAIGHACRVRPGVIAHVATELRQFARA